MRYNLYFTLLISIQILLSSSSLKSQNCYENLVVFKKDTMYLDSFQLKCLDYNIRVFKIFKRYDTSSNLNLLVQTCENDLQKNNSIGRSRDELLRRYLISNYSITELDLTSIDKSNSVKTGFCNNYGGIIEFKIIMTKPISKKLARKIKRVKV